MRTPDELLEFATTNVAYRRARGNLHYRAVDALLLALLNLEWVRICTFFEHFKVRGQR